VLCFALLVAQQPNSDLGPIIVEVSGSHSDTSHSVRLLWTSGRPVVEIFTGQHTTFVRDRHLYSPARFEPAVPASDRPQTDVLDRAATGIGTFYEAYQITRDKQLQIDGTPYDFDVK